MWLAIEDGHISIVLVAVCRFGEHFASFIWFLAKVLYGHISEVVNEKWAYFYRNCQDWSIYATHHSSHLRWHMASQG